MVPPLPPKEVQNDVSYWYPQENKSDADQDKKGAPIVPIQEKTLNLQNTNPLILTFKAMEYAARGPVILRAMAIENELKQGVLKPFSEVVKANLGDAHAMGQKPMTFVRQVLALVSFPDLIDESFFPDDVKKKAKSILTECRGGSAGSYSDSKGLALIRKHAAEYIERRDDGLSANAEDIVLCAGASEGIRACLKLFREDGSNGIKAGILTPIPQYPLYSATLKEYDMLEIGYYLNEDKGWGLDVEELERAIKDASGRCNPRAIVVINPGNPTGHVLTRSNMEEIIRLAYRQKLFLLADEVYQDNVYEDNKFLSFKKVMKEMGSPFDQMELVSFFSTSKGFLCECGLRGAYFEVVNMDPEVKEILFASVAAKLCPTVLGQVAVDCVVSPPRDGDPSFQLFQEEKTSFLDSLSERAKILTEGFNSLPGIKCTPIQGAMYSFPRVAIPEKAVQLAKEKGMEPDVFYALELVEATGICVVPGSGIGQYPGTYHFRTTILPPTDKVRELMEKFKIFHLDFMQKYSA